MTKKTYRPNLTSSRGVQGPARYRKTDADIQTAFEARINDSIAANHYWDCDCYERQGSC